MRIQHNTAALNAWSQLGKNNNSVSKSLEKLSSGYRINRAGDDAAGLAISEKMRAQIKGLETATKNATDGISLVQTAEGALTEVHSMLNRMVELATQSANGTYDNETDRANLQKEVESLQSEINRISESTNYNGINLLDGSLSSTKVTLNSAADGEKEVFLDNGSADIAISGRADATKYEVTLDAVDTPSAVDDTLTINFNVDGKEHSITFTGKVAGDITDDNIAIALAGGSGNVLAVDTDAATTEALSVFNQNFTFDNTGDGKITAKTAGTANTASISSISVSGTMTFDGGGTATKSGIISTASAKDAGYTLTLPGANPTTAGTLKLGDKSIDITTADTRDTILSKLVDAGITASAGTLGTEISIVEDNNIKAEQTGTGISASNTSLVVTADKASAATFAIASTAGGAAAEHKLTINYVDIDGTEKTKELDYTSANVATDNNTAMANAIKADDDLKNLFDVSSDANGITLTAKLKGENGAVLKGITSDDSTATVLGKMTVTKGEDKGTILSFGNDSTGADGSFKAGDTLKINGKTYEFTDGTAAAGDGNTSVSVGTSVEDTFKNLKDALLKDGIESKITGTGATATLEISDTAASNERGKGGLTLQVGDTAEKFNKVTVSVGNMNTKSLGIDGINVASQTDASATIDKIKAAINTVSATRGDLGAIQNRLEHTINNLGVASENMTGAESRIRDVDMAAEMMEFTKNNILTQASQAMLAQANQLPQGVLQLLQ